VLTINTIFGLLRDQALWLMALSIIANTGAWIWLIVVVRRQSEKVRSLWVELDQSLPPDELQL